MNILIIPSWYENYKNKTHGSFFKEQAKSLADKGHNVYILYVDIIRFNEVDRILKTKKYHQYEENNLKVYRKKVIKIPKTAEKYVAKKVKDGVLDLYEKFISDNINIDVIHAHSFVWGGYAASELSKKYNIPVMVTEHYSGFARNLMGKDEQLIISDSMESVDKIVSVSSGLKEKMKKYTDKDIIVIPNIVEDSIFNTINPTKYKKNKKFTFFSVAYLSQIKGMDILLNAFKEVLFEENECELIIGGDGIERKNLEKLSKELQIDKNVNFIGALSRREVAQNMKECDCFVLPSRYETFGVVYIEALACGKPVIGTKTDAIYDIIDNQNGLVIDIEDIEALKNAMIYIKKHYLKYSSQEISNKCIQKFGTKSISDKIENELYLISKKGRKI